ncbi:MAG: hypothetical protein FRX48_09463 [Lasallia pustulata]|uniref:C2H2-type domain-containing protein n=1 Tax=Lasallia pustulata TaxID=136370 RepID=A0A5M8PCT2_9LECA|nr:MAG: hypothetical protein FRX48_09463 [Lasallia pustulata]
MAADDAARISDCVAATIFKTLAESSVSNSTVTLRDLELNPTLPISPYCRSFATPVVVPTTVYQITGPISVQRCLDSEPQGEDCLDANSWRASVQTPKLHNLHELNRPESPSGSSPSAAISPTRRPLLWPDTDSNNDADQSAEQILDSSGNSVSQPSPTSLADWSTAVQAIDDPHQQAHYGQGQESIISGNVVGGVELRNKTASPRTQSTPVLQHHYLCSSCPKVFRHRHELNRHRKLHDRPYRCLHVGCDSRGFSSRKDLGRHEASRHQGTEATKFYCPRMECEYSTKGFPRTDNCRRHVRKQHGMKFVDL